MLKHYLCVIVAFHIFVKMDQKNHLPKNKQLLNLLYDDVESLSSIFSWCNRVRIVVSMKDRLALSHGDNPFDMFCIIVTENRLQTN